jgi:ATP-binding cassette subfamily C protein
MLQVYDRVLQSGSITTLAFLSVVLVASLGVMAFLDALRLRLFAAGARRLDRLVTPILLQETLRKGHGHRGAPQAALQSFDVFRNAITGAPALAAVDAPWAPLYVIVCFLIHPWIGILALIGGAALVVLAWWNETALRPQGRPLGPWA